eukprot:maker-scaffold_6-snap-gene-13.5-mRNA-1 protein AED:0.00 eAED:0.00 QI:284/1/1/1/1/1/2/195/611
MSLETSEKVIFLAKNGDWPIRSVTVYEDQAEVCRVLEYVPDSSGQIDLKLEGLTSKINFDSVRAEVSSKNATLVEVIHETQWLVKHQKEKLTAELEDVKLQLKSLAKETSYEDKNYSRIETKLSQIKSHQASVLTVINRNVLAEDAQTTGQYLLDPSIFKGVTESTAFYEELIAKANEELNQSQAEKYKLSDKRNKLQTRKAFLEKSFYSRDVTVTIEIPYTEEEKKKKEAVIVKLYYLVNPGSAEWKASYDVRLNRVEGKTPEFIELTYYGEIQNKTEEDWEEVELSLSTAQPSLGGSLPPLPRLDVDFKERAVGGHLRGLGSTFRAHSLSAAPQLQNVLRGSFAMNANLDLGVDMLEVNDALVADEALSPVTANVSGESGATFFQIQRLVTIESSGGSGSQSKRQTITITQLKPSFAYAASPKVSPDVFLRCTTKNTSEFPFLEGKVGVFMDNSFVANSKMNFVRKNEKFSVFFGVDNGVRLDYKPEKLLKKQKNALFSSNTKSKTFLREITLINTKKEDIDCILYEQIPYSTEEKKIKVAVLNPEFKGKKELKTKEYTAKINNFNNLECHKTIKAGKSWKLKFEYSVQWPANDGNNIAFYTLPDNIKA